MNVRRLILSLVAVVIVLPIIAAGVFVATFNPNAYKPRIIAAVERATGRTLALNGPIGLKLSLVPTIEASDVSLANTPDGSRKQMVTLGRMEAQVALLPLLSGRLDIRKLVLVKPDILLETNAKGQGNWLLHPSAATPAPAVAPAPATVHGKPVRIDVRAVSITGGRITYRNGQTGHVAVLALNHVTAAASSAGAEMSVAASATWNGAAFTLHGKTGPVARLTDPASHTPWPVSLTLAAYGATAQISGTITQPLQGRGYHLTLSAKVPALEALAPFVPGVALPKLHGLTLAATAADAGAALPRVTGVALHVAASDLGTFLPGLTLTSLDVTDAGLDQPAKIQVVAARGGVPVSLAATLGAPQALLAPPKNAPPYPVSAVATAGAARLAVNGTLAQPEKLAGANLAAVAQVPDLAALAPLAGRALPLLKSIAFKGTITDGPGGFAQGVSVRQMALTMPQADASGELTLALRPRPSLTAVLTSTRVDADALTAALKLPPAATPAGKLAPPPPPPLPKPGRAQATLIPDTPLPVAALRGANADIRLSIGTLLTGGVTYRTISGRLLLQNGRLQVQPFAAQLPGGHLDLTAMLDASGPVPHAALTLTAPGLALQPLLAAFGQKPQASGTLEVYANLSGTGATPHAIAAGLNGQVGLAMVNGTVDGKLLDAVFGGVLRTAGLPPGVMGQQGAVPVRCFAVHLVANRGIAQLQPLLLDSNRLYAEGGGAMNLGAETLDLQLRPRVQIGGRNIFVPVRVRGTFLHPAFAVDAAGTARTAAGLAGQLLGKGSPLGGLAQSLLGGPAADTCPQALAAARMGHPGPLPAAAAQTAPAAPKPAGVPSIGGIKLPKNLLNFLHQ